ncbi:MAG TPA: hypothetical protein VGB82_28480 [Alphaproteobacteria bacterium]
MGALQRVGREAGLRKAPDRFSKQTLPFAEREIHGASAASVAANRGFRTRQPDGKLANIEFETIARVKDPWKEFNPPK